MRMACSVRYLYHGKLYVLFVVRVSQECRAIASYQAAADHELSILPGAECVCARARARVCACVRVYSSVYPSLSVIVSVSVRLSVPLCLSLCLHMTQDISQERSFGSSASIPPVGGRVLLNPVPPFIYPPTHVNIYTCVCVLVCVRVCVRVRVCV